MTVNYVEIAGLHTFLQNAGVPAARRDSVTLNISRLQLVLLYKSTSVYLYFFFHLALPVSQFLCHSLSSHLTHFSDISRISSLYSCSVLTRIQKSLNQCLLMFLCYSEGAGHIYWFVGACQGLCRVFGLFWPVGALFYPLLSAEMGQCLQYVPGMCLSGRLWIGYCTGNHGLCYRDPK